MEFAYFLILAGVAFALLCGVICARIAEDYKTEHPVLWFIVGFCLGPLGIGLALLSRRKL